MQHILSAHFENLVPQALAAFFAKYVTLRNFFATFWIEKGRHKASFLG